MDIEAAISNYGSLRGSVCWDLGAHFGIYTVGMAFAVGPTGHVYGFEPNPASFARCEHHVRRNALDWVKIFNFGVSDAEGALDLLVGRGLVCASTSHFVYEDERPKPDVPRVRVRLVMLDSLVERGEVLPPHFIKVDVEGHGAKALKGAQRTITAHLPIIVMSFHSLWERDGTRELLEHLGYKPYGTAGAELGWDASLYRTAVLTARPPDEAQTRLKTGEVMDSNSRNPSSTAS
jgi:FkbM family methyltransferase